jgi:hypothetical protein
MLPVMQSMFGFSSYLDSYNHIWLWQLHDILYRSGVGKVSFKLLERYSNEINDNSETHGIVINSIMMMAYHLTTTKKYKGVFLKHLEDFDSRDIANAIRKLGKETRATLKRHGMIDPMAKAFLNVKLRMPDKGMNLDEKFGFKIFMYGLFMLRSRKIEGIVFKYL